MKILAVLLAVLLALLGIRLLFAALKAAIMFFKVDVVPARAKQILFRDMVMGILLLILAVAILN